MAQQITLKLKTPDDELAKEVAKKYGFEVKGESFLDSHYFLHYSDSDQTLAEKTAQLDKLNSDPLVEWAKIEQPKTRKKVLDEF
ncbi:unnamed protein product [Bursaphelenchus xylophilus]|uniref:(pine wood nematode) hypothetical protein n=1 Tax=Bursaphelenchus xylophilus TaxID=6326 RepID=A0A1I7S8P1_BURXY|nr:unnamed protein product [Bursaphelenchus xylophilus]CAG9089407.1 unnamed protein product [Bursaphelenchus xylophilus]